MDLKVTPELLRETGADAWLVYDFRGSNPVFAHLLGARPETTRRAYLTLDGSEATVIAHELDAHLFDLPTTTYVTWRDLEERLRALIERSPRVAMEYSPRGELPGASWVDAGTVELIRDLGGEVVPAADLFQRVAARWDAEAKRSQERAIEHLVEVRDAALGLVRERLASGTPVTEHEVQSLMYGQLERRGLETEGTLIVASGPNSGNPHYETGEDPEARVEPDAVLMLDLWAREPGERTVFGDITWMAYAGASPPPEVVRVFEAVRGARDAVLGELGKTWPREMRGWELDRLARESIAAAGYEHGLRHRTGHSLGPGSQVHALGANLDDFETHDTRVIAPGTGFTVEPGIYLDDFGIRLEVDVFVDPDAGPRTTSPVQTELELLA